MYSNMSKSLILCLLALLVCSTAAIPAAAPVRPPAGAVKVTSLDVDLDGGGCKPGEASVSIVRDNSALTIIFDNFEAADGPKAGSAKSRAFCRITIGVSSPGYALDIDTVDFRGYVLLEKGVEASLVSRWKWVDKNGVDLKGKGNVQKIVQGPFNNDVLLHKNGELSDNEPSVCQKKDAKLQISLSATVSSGTSQKNGYVQGSAQDIGFGETLNLSWKKC
ncbi:hypothetical protein FB567DRAFT_224114 [Paraphoma chrysanthemicola]|uniref:DUF4360 domain-containing protein n=1 Tax=Paraphoma chrysanthemicola TaxID=798071 RepID=A0A8K0QSD9_9PLEO|nr:hypothetical protein FB567DRAFT_224114 [Paraphoma chrysanthemicola]